MTWPGKCLLLTDCTVSHLCANATASMAAQWEAPAQPPRLWILSPVGQRG